MYSFPSHFASPFLSFSSSIHLSLSHLFRFLARHLSGPPRDDVHVGDGVDGEQHVAGGDAQEVQGSGQQAQDLLGVQQARHHKEAKQSHQEHHIGGRP